MTLTTRPAPLDIYEEFPDLHALGRVAFRLHPRRGRDLPATSSKMGGAFLNPDGSPWPEDEAGAPYIPLIQLFKRDLVQRSLRDLEDIPFLLSAECVQVLWLPNAIVAETEVRFVATDGGIPEMVAIEPGGAAAGSRPMSDYEPRIVVRWLDDAQVRRARPHRVPPHDSHDAELFPNECSLHPERILDYPHRWALSRYFQDLLLANPRFLRLAEAHGQADNPLGFYQTHLGSASGVKLGGHPDWVQDPAWPMSGGWVLDHLLTLSSLEWDSGNCGRWKPIEDGDPVTSDGPNDDAGLMIGDAGNAYIFASTTGEAKIVTQCS